MRFSQRTTWEEANDEFARAVARLPRGQPEVIDLAVANPAACGLGPAPEATLEPLKASAAMQYTPDPLGIRSAREAVCGYYGRRGAGIDADQVCLTTSTSEAYSFLFRLLADPGDEVLIARPSYPLFDLLARLDDVVLREYPLLYEPGYAADEGGWSVDMEALAASVTPRTRAIIVVHPNNPTGHYVSASERQELVALCAERGLALIVDEVFLDYALDLAPQHKTFAGEEGCLCFVLSGISKVCALPQMKVSWMTVSGPATQRAEALRRLEIVADTFLSLNAPAQHALGSWLEASVVTQQAIRERLRTNVRALDERLKGSLGSRLGLQGGWTAVLRVPRYADGEEFALAALRRGALVQPGRFYGLGDGHCVVSLLTAPEVWREGLRRLPL